MQQMPMVLFYVTSITLYFFSSSTKHSNAVLPEANKIHFGLRLSVLTWVPFAEHFNGSRHFLFTDAFIFLPLGGGLEPLPGQRTQVEVHQNIAQRLQVVPP